MDCRPLLLIASAKMCCAAKPVGRLPIILRRVFGGPKTKTPNTKQSLRVQMTLEQACPLEYQRAQCAFKDSMIH